jgi:hypothetical protein
LAGTSAVLTEGFRCVLQSPWQRCLELVTTTYFEYLPIHHSQTFDTTEFETLTVFFDWTGNYRRASCFVLLWNVGVLFLFVWE